MKRSDFMKKKLLTIINVKRLIKYCWTKLNTGAVSENKKSSVHSFFHLVHKYQYRDFLR